MTDQTDSHRDTLVRLARLHLLAEDDELAWDTPPDNEPVLLIRGGADQGLAGQTAALTIDGKLAVLRCVADGHLVGATIDAEGHEKVLLDRTPGNID